MNESYGKDDMQTLKQRMRDLEQHAYWQWLEHALRSLTNEELYWLYDALETAPEVEIEDVTRLLRECRQY